MKSTKLSYEARTRIAVRSFWNARSAAALKQRARGRSDQGNRAAVTTGNTMNSFCEMVVEVARQSGPAEMRIHQNKSMVVLPGFFRPTKSWDLLLTCGGRLLAAVELKSLCGPSFGNNANNRCEEALGSGTDFRQAQRDSLFGRGANPFLGYFILIEDKEGSRRPVNTPSPHFPTDKAFLNASYQSRMQLMCERLVQHQIYSAASVMTAPAAKSGEFLEPSRTSSFRNLLLRLSQHLQAEEQANENPGRVEESRSMLFSEDPVFDDPNLGELGL